MNVFGFLLDHLSWVLATVGLVTAAYLYLNHKYSYFEKRGIAYDKSTGFISSFVSLIFSQKAFYDDTCDYYQKFKGKSFVGLYQIMDPIIFVRDLELIKKICIKDFDHFVDRSFPLCKDVNGLFHKSLLGLEGEPWKDMRNTLTPAFTSSKMKAMLSLIDDCGQNMTKYLEKMVREHKPDKSGEPLTVEMRSFFTKYATDVIATCAFGIKCDSFHEPDNIFYEMGKGATDFNGLRSIVLIGYLISTKLMRFLNISFVPRKVSTFFRSIISNTVKQREREGIVRPDMIHLLMQARKGELKTDATDEEENIVPRRTKAIDMDDETLAAQAYLFLIGGFDTTSTLMCFVTQILAMHPEIQERLRLEIEETLAGKKATYDKIHGMKYLDCVVSETLRLYSPGVGADRVCVKDYVIPATGTTPECTIEKGVGVFIPFCALQRDPEYFPDPMKFDPERFSDENKHNIQPYTYQPFGLGPRNCIGNRFALMEVKTSLVYLLPRFNFHVVSKTQVPIKFAKGGFTVAIEGGYWVGFTLRDQ